MLTQEETVIMQHLLIEDEGMRQFPYFDCCGKFFRKCNCAKQGILTVGIGRNLETVGLRDSEAEHMVLNDIKLTCEHLERCFSWFKTLNTPRRIVIVSMAFNLGITGLKQFQKMIKCIESGDFESASKHMLASKWATQVHSRAIRLATIMKTGQF